MQVWEGTWSQPPGNNQTSAPSFVCSSYASLRPRPGSAVQRNSGGCSTYPGQSACTGRLCCSSLRVCVGVRSGVGQCRCQLARVQIVPRSLARPGTHTTHATNTKELFFLPLLCSAAAAAHHVSQRAAARSAAAQAAREGRQRDGTMRSPRRGRRAREMRETQSAQGEGSREWTQEDAMMQRLLLKAQRLRDNIRSETTPEPCLNPSLAVPRENQRVCVQLACDQRRRMSGGSHRLPRTLHACPALPCLPAHTCSKPPATPQPSPPTVCWATVRRGRRFRAPPGAQASRAHTASISRHAYWALKSSAHMLHLHTSKALCGSYRSDAAACLPAVVI